MCAVCYARCYRWTQIILSLKSSQCVHREEMGSQRAIKSYDGRNGQKVGGCGRKWLQVEGKDKKDLTKGINV